MSRKLPRLTMAALVPLIWLAVMPMQSLADVPESTDEINATAVRPDGKIVAVGTVDSAYFALARYESDGSLDLGFGEGGRVVTEIPAMGRAVARDVAIQPDGKLVVVGDSARDSASQIRTTVARYDPDGSLDTTFGLDGVVLLDFNSSDKAFGLAVALSGDRIVVGGYSWMGESPRYDFAVSRLNADGSPDEGFSGDGTATVDFAGGLDTASDIAVQADGAVVITGTRSRTVLGDVWVSNLATARLTPGGTLDTTFGGDGRVVTDLGSTLDSADAIVLQPDGKIVIGGQVGHSTNDFALVRYTAAGVRDAAFGRLGIVFTDLSARDDRIWDLALDGDRIVAIGESMGASSADNHAGVARYTATGALDTTFGSGGTVLGDPTYAYAGAVQPDGSVIAAGRDEGEADWDFALARYRADGSPDASFGVDGLVTTDF